MNYTRVLGLGFTISLLSLLMASCGSEPATPLLLSTEIASSPSATAPAIPTPTKPPPPTATLPDASPTPAISVEPQELLGIWNGSRGAFLFREDGTWAYSHALDSLLVAETRHAGDYTFDGNALSMAGLDCGSKAQPIAQTLIAKDADKLTFSNLTLDDYCSQDDPAVYTRTQYGDDDWLQLSQPGFNQPGNIAIQDFQNFSIPDLKAYYLGTLNPTTGAQLWQRPYTVGAGPLGAWRFITKDGFGNPANIGIARLTAFDEKLYAGTTSDGRNGAEVWRSVDGLKWDQVAAKGFGDPTNNEIADMIEFAGQLYVSTGRANASRGAEVWRSASGDADTWEQVVKDGFGKPGNRSIPSLALYDGSLYAGALNGETGVEVWRSVDGAEWAQLNLDGFIPGNPLPLGTSSFAVFADALYVAAPGSPTSPSGVEVWRCQTCDGSDWSRVLEAELDGESVYDSASLVNHRGVLFLVAGSISAGPDAWQTSNGDQWQAVSEDGLDISSSPETLSGYMLRSVRDRLWLGTRDPTNAGQLWEYIP